MKVFRELVAPITESKIFVLLSLQHGRMVHCQNYVSKRLSAKTTSRDAIMFTRKNIYLISLKASYEKKNLSTCLTIYIIKN